MKKFKFKGGVKGVLLEHGEKAVFGFGVLCFLLFTYGLFGRETLPPDKEPPRLTEAVTQAKDFMEHQTWDATREGIAVVDYRSRAKRDDVVAGNFALLVPFDLPLRDMKHKRIDPSLLAVLSLHTAAGVGAFALKSEKEAIQPVAPTPAPAKPASGRSKRKSSGENLLESKAPETAPTERVIEGEKARVGGLSKGVGSAVSKKQNWVVVTALVPVKKQFAEYEKVFKDTIPVLDAGPAAQNKDTEKQRDTPNYRRPIIERAEVVDGTAPPNWAPVNMRGLGKFIKQWAVVAPDIVGHDYLDPAYTMPLGPLVGADWDSSVGHEQEIPLLAEEELEKNEALANAGKPEAEDAGDVDNPFGMAAGGAAPAKPVVRPSATAKPAEKRIVEYGLFRFFDFEVESGKTYRYRVRLVMSNPNYNLPDKYLKSLDSKKDEFRETPWSEPSPPATVPFGEEMMVASVQPAKASKEATIKVKLTTIDEELGIPAVMEEEVTRGTLLNFVKTVEVRDLLVGKWRKRENVSFNTNAVVLDIRGGQALSSKDKHLTAAGEALIINSDMKLVAHNELDDLELYEANPTPGTDKPEVKSTKKKDDPNKLLDSKQPLRKRSKRKPRSRG